MSKIVEGIAKDLKSIPEKLKAKTGNVDKKTPASIPGRYHGHFPESTFSCNGCSSPYMKIVRHHAYRTVCGSDLSATEFQILFRTGRFLFPYQSVPVYSVTGKVAIHGLCLGNVFSIAFSSREHCLRTRIFFKIKKGPSGSFQKGKCHPCSVHMGT